MTREEMAVELERIDDFDSATLNRGGLLDIAAELRKMAWRPIETAPKDCLILSVRGSYAPFVARWCDRGGYFRGDGEADGVHPTHWMPLPDSPSEPQP